MLYTWKYIYFQESTPILSFVFNTICISKLTEWVQYDRKLSHSPTFNPMMIYVEAEDLIQKVYFNLILVDGIGNYFHKEVKTMKISNSDLFSELTDYTYSTNQFRNVYVDRNPLCLYCWMCEILNWWLIIHWLLSCPGIFHSQRGVTVVCEWLQNSNLCLAVAVSGQVATHLLWHGAFVYTG